MSLVMDTWSAYSATRRLNLTIPTASLVYILRLHLLKVPQDALRFPLETGMFIRTEAADAPLSPTLEAHTLSEMDAVWRGAANRAYS